MPTPRKYASNAERQACYRARAAGALADVVAAKGLPNPSPISAIPSRRRWQAMANNGRSLFAAISDEMQAYADSRSDEWQESERGEEFTEQITVLDEILQAIDELSI